MIDDSAVGMIRAFHASGNDFPGGLCLCGAGHRAKPAGPVMERFQFATLSALLTGIAFAVAVVETLAAITYERIGFRLMFRRGRLGVLALPLLVFTGPVILFRAAADCWSDPRLGKGVAVLGALAALFWALASGHLLMRILGWTVR